MGPAYYVIAILGCADGSAACTPVATLPVQYADRKECTAAVPRALAANTDLDFPTLVAECRSSTRPTAARPQRNQPVLASARRG